MGWEKKGVNKAYKLKTILEKLDSKPMFTKDILDLCDFAAHYYHHPIGEVVTAALPAILRKGKTPKKIAALSFSLLKNSPEKIILNEAQSDIVKKMGNYLDIFQVFLLEGVTGSGKTEVYLQMMANVLERGQQVLVLVPEIGLTPQMAEHIAHRFKTPIALLHSGMSEKERFNHWWAIKEGHVKIIVGTRLSVFTPFANLGLIVIDEEHDVSFKQQEGFRYHARDLAIWRARYLNIPIILGSATPSLETLHNAAEKKFLHFKLTTRAGNALLPEFKIIDIRNQYLQESLSANLLTEMTNHLKKGNQVMLFLNRRGFAPLLICHVCGWIAKCPRCDVAMTYHTKPLRLHCHHCDYQNKVISQCGACGQQDLQTIGQGTEKLETFLEKNFTEYKVARIDRDSTRKKGAIKKYLEAIHDGTYQILLGTQMLAKGHHFPNVTLVGIVDTDSGFFSTDFRALERMGQLLLQVAGRSGRQNKKGLVMIQTRHPNHPLLQQLINENYTSFSNVLLKDRKDAKLPPYSYFALFRVRAHQMKDAQQFLLQIKAKMLATTNLFDLLGPFPAPLAKRAGYYCVQLLVQTQHRKDLQNLLNKTVQEIEKIPLQNRVRWSLDVDPVEMV